MNIKELESWTAGMAKSVVEVLPLFQEREQAIFASLLQYYMFLANAAALKHSKDSVPASPEALLDE